MKCSAGLFVGIDMLLYLMRHGHAEHAAGSGEIELTDNGSAIVRHTLEAFKGFGLPHVVRIIASPLKRAQQTAAIARRMLNVNAEIETAVQLQSETDPLVTLAFIASLPHTAPTMLVGHDPLFSTIASMLVAGTDIPVVPMSKSSICAIELTRFEVPRMRGVLRAFIPPAESE